MKSDFNSHFAYFVTDLDLEKLEGDALGDTMLVAHLLVSILNQVSKM